MPSWKKVLISGSDAALNSLTVTNGITGSLFGTASYALNAGGGTLLYTHTQSVASNTWTVPHNLGTSFPIITVYDNSNNVVIPQEITSTSTSSLSITFPVPIAGYASVAGGTFNTVSQGTTQEQSIINAIVFG